MPRDALKVSHVGIRMNSKFAQMEARLSKALDATAQAVKQKTGLTIRKQARIYLQTIVDTMNVGVGKATHRTFVRAYVKGQRTCLRPDGSFWYVEEWGDPKRWVLIAEAKCQGTNDERLKVGKEEQSRGNAVERLGKNMRGIDALLLGEGITPFACFGEGCDFAPNSSILDRVSTLNGFFALNEINVDKIPIPRGLDILRPASLFFRNDPWTPQEMHEVLLAVCLRSIEYYRKKYDLK